MQIPTRAIKKVVDKMKETVEDDIISIDDITMEIMCPKERHNLILPVGINHLQVIFVTRDEVSKRMG